MVAAIALIEPVAFATCNDNIGGANELRMLRRFHVASERVIGGPSAAIAVE